MKLSWIKISLMKNQIDEKIEEKKLMKKIIEKI